MFTGIVQGKATVVAADRRPEFMKLKLRLPPGEFPDRLGESVGVNGVCLTIERIDPDGVGFHLLTETLGVTNLGELRPGSIVNFERALRVGQSIGGHNVLGHVDATAEITESVGREGQWELTVRVPAHLLPYVAPKGSIAIDGVSLTIARIDGDRCMFALIPETLRLTILGDKKPGDRVNVEADYLAKLIVAQIARMREQGQI